jgi:hypothetical protein
MRQREAKRQRLANLVELKEWWYVPDQHHPKEVRAIVKSNAQGVFSGHGYGKGRIDFEIDEWIFELRVLHEKTVKAGEEFEVTYVAGETEAEDQLTSIELCLTLKIIEGRDTIDISKVYKNEITTGDDGSFFYVTLPLPRESQLLD